MNAQVDGTTTTAYSNMFFVSDADVWSSHFVWTEDVATFAAAVTLWATNLENPDEATDTDWVQMTASHGFSGLPGGDPSGGSGKDFVDISASGAIRYRWKVVRSTGTGTVQIIVGMKDNS